MKKPEILAPAGSMESLRAAVAAGCDAVYIGGSRFGARAYASNPAGDEMVQAIEYCHLHGVRIYMTVNTLLKERELGEMYSYMLPYYEAGLDAAIVQDVGVMRSLHQWFPDLPIHASTQMTLTMGQSTRLLERYGVTRIVPARELSLDELKQMRQDTNLELEVFVHGALCYCYSGQCLFSSMQGGRSGNRGRCAQPCRMLYQHEKEKSYLLSPRELCNLSYVGELSEMGIDSLKIEGRMKRPEYTAFVTAMFRKYVDLYASLGREEYQNWQKKNQRQWQDDMRKLAELYNRTGFTKGYLEGDAGVPFQGKHGIRGTMLSDRRPKHGGVQVGKVLSVDRHTVTYRLLLPVHPQDVVEFRDAESRTLYEYTIGTPENAGKTVTARYQKGCRIRPGDLVYRTKDADLLQEIQKTILGRELRIGISGVFQASEGEKCSLTISDGNCEVTVCGEEAGRAKNRPAEEVSVRKSLCQTGDSPFVFEELQIVLKGDLFLSVGGIKKLRREALEQLRQKILERDRRKVDENRLVRESAEVADEGQWGTGISATVMTWEQLMAVLTDPSVEEVALKMDLLSDEKLQEGLCRIRESGRRSVLVLPAICRRPVWSRYEQQIRQGKGIFCGEQPDGYLVKNLESFLLLRDILGVKTDQIRTDAGLYVMNSSAAAWWQEQGVCQMTAPLELTSGELSKLKCRNRMQMIVYGHIPLMVSAQCTVFNTSGCVAGKEGQGSIFSFQDQKNREFVGVNYCKYCYNIIYQGVPLNLCGEISDIQEMGFSGCRYDFTVEDAEETLAVLKGKMPEQSGRGHFDLGIE